MTDDSEFGSEDTIFGASNNDTVSGGGGNDTVSGGGGNDTASGGGGTTNLPAGPGVNSMILDAVKQSNSAVLGASGENGASIAYQKVAQAAAFAVQDSTDYLRNIMAMSAAATGVALQKMVANPSEATLYEPILTQANLAVTNARTNFTDVGSAAGTIVKDFPSS
ncbi:hypothetical protein NUH88_11505 [Nisaea acidiphila]|uniref:Uncharacterized protein n=1 Tax=Nisaea acidiphila TaxID=1862145 RepID=A0A9J7ARV7_9PROT|nr:hypothetical protein [Nisaea acidiphila]UUX48045.1 hypothetical protein NUH88_11505 [Nisaea acidiphila]